MRRLGLLAAGICIGLVLTEYLIHKDREKEETAEPERHDGLFAELSGNTVKMYRVVNGRFCGYHETKTFDSRDEALDWISKETNAKIVITA